MHQHDDDQTDTSDQVDDTDEPTLTLTEQRDQLRAAGVTAEILDKRLFYGRHQIRAARAVVRQYARRQRRAEAAPHRDGATAMGEFIAHAQRIAEPDERQAAQITAVIAARRAALDALVSPDRPEGYRKTQAERARRKTALAEQRAAARAEGHRSLAKYARALRSKR